MNIIQCFHKEGNEGLCWSKEGLFSIHRVFLRRLGHPCNYFDCRNVYISESNTRERLRKADNHKDIIEACKRNDRQAQFELYRLYSKGMYNVALRIVKSGDEANDMIQNSFIDVFKHIHSFKYEAAVGAWIKRIVINNCINFLRKKKLDLVELQEGYHDRTEEVEALPKGLSVDAVKRALGKLPQGYSAIFSLYAFEGYDHGEIAEILGVSESTSKSQYSRAKMKLRQILTSEAFINQG